MLLRSSARVGLSLSIAFLSACTTDNPEGQTEPVAPSEETTPYPEDPDMAKMDEGSSVPPEASPDEEPVGELTDDPFDKGATAPAEEPPTEIAEDGLPVPDEGDTYEGAFEDKQPGFEKAPGGAPEVTPPDIKDDVTSPMADVDSDTQTASAPQGKATYYVDAILLNVRSRASQKAPIVRRLLGGAKIHVEVKGAWGKIKNGQWVRSRYLSTSPTRKVSRKEAEKAWQGSRYKDTWKPGKK